MGAGTKELLAVLCANVLSVLQFAVPVWTTMLTRAEEHQIESVLKTGLYLVLGPHRYKSYKWALNESKMITLKQQRNQIFANFTKSCLRNEKFSKWFELTEVNNGTVTRSKKSTYKMVPARTQAYERSPIPQMTIIANQLMSKS